MIRMSLKGLHFYIRNYNNKGINNNNNKDEDEENAEENDDNDVKMIRTNTRTM